MSLIDAFSKEDRVPVTFTDFLIWYSRRRSMKMS